MAPKYVIRLARDEESSDGWVWIGGPSKNNPTKRGAMKITRPGFARGVYAEARTIEPRFLAKYNSPPRHHISLNEDTVVMGEWYRDALGIPKATPGDKKSGLIELTIEEASFWGLGELPVACQHPDPMVRLGARFSVLGAWLGLLTLADLALKVCEPFVKQIHWVRWLRTYLPMFWTTENFHACVVLVVALLLAVPCILICRGRPLPRQP
jgi:hypothetical protein